MHNKDPITLLVVYKQGKKVTEVDITDMPEREIARIILIQDNMGRRWGYEFTNLKEMRERRESYE